MTPEQCRLMFERFQQLNPHPTTELIYHSPFELLIAVMLSAQATDASVNLATRELFQVAPTPRQMLKLGLDGLQAYIRRINYYPTKAKHIIASCHILLSDFAGTVPDNLDDLLRLPGVGRKTAHVILNTLYGQDTIAVDTHIFRVCNRTKLAPGKNPRAVEQGLMQIVPLEFRLHAHHWLILHGRYICVARKPKCSICPIQDLCPFPKRSNL